MEALLTSQGFIAGTLSGTLLGFTLAALIRLLRRKRKFQDIPFHEFKEHPRSQPQAFLEIPVEQILSKEKTRNRTSVQQLKDKLQRFRLRNQFYTDK